MLTCYYVNPTVLVLAEMMSSSAILFILVTLGYAVNTITDGSSCTAPPALILLGAGYYMLA